MAQAEKKAKALTPGRPKKAGNQFFDVGKIGRKTGITLEDKGLRDEHGLEPVSHIFSSPVSPQRRAVDDSDANMQESSGPEVNMTLTSRKTPRLPPPRASTPKHTNIGSPKRMSTGRPSTHRMSAGLEGEGTPAPSKTQPPPNRVLDFGGEEDVHKSIESPSPFKPRHVLRRSTGGGKSIPFASVSPTKDVQQPDTIPEGDEDTELQQPEAEEEPEVQPPAQDGPLMLDEDDQFYDAQPAADEEQSHAGAAEEVPVKRKPGRPRKSLDSSNSQVLQASPVVTKKRTRASLEDSRAGEANVSESQVSESAPAQKKRRGGRPPKNKIPVLQDVRDIPGDSGPLIDGGESVTEAHAAEHPNTSVPLANGDESVAEANEAEPFQPITKGKGKGKGRKAKAPKERDANQAMRPQGSPVKLNDSPSKLRNRREGSRALSVGPISNVHLRASTPFEDADTRTSRFGRNLTQPLKYWANEMRIYKHGEIAGIVRADPVEETKRRGPKKRTGKKNRKSKLDGIDEESDSGSTHADEWEDDVGVIADLGFASSSIITREVANSEFKYAKIMTLPFFGSGVVELPPQGFKRAKNSRKMQMCFFVHEGKVMVDVGAQGEGVEANQFAIAKGGCFVVPRGNNYAITNESGTRTARIFFAQGCEVAELAK
ncbi:mitotic fidelity of chromosome transmission-related protein [Vermiconidia calcicola]|uniref:Mitotic fidelity of chromosome transmission-related protein n=1 Tax=Vermiconidia calcicola TaxID=1690605 RepID=A0ACC3MBC7_9PEZI|nr:mitotic fidelity of chromosome transmission-related protein [Vermiconidia calcicola]